MKLSILYRGPLSSCNYGCDYCPFAKRHETATELALDRTALARFTAWAGRQEHELSFLFTPWGEALVHRHYQEALAELTHLPQVRKAAIQTNLSCSLGWLERCRRERLALWATFHPTETTLPRFLEQVRRVHAAGVRLSVGVVGLKEHLPLLRDLRRGVPEGIYVWVNAYKRTPSYYTEDEAAFLTGIDPHFPTNNTRHASRGHACRAGDRVIAVDGDGVIRRCHFVPQVLGNIYEAGWEAALAPRPCTKETCDCHIGYVHLERLGLERVYGDGILERIPIS